MNFVSVFMAVFSVLGGIDLIIGNRFGIGEEFEKGFKLFGVMALSMIGMIVLAPVLGELMKPLSNFVYNVLHIDPSIVPAMLFANDMGGASLSEAMAENDALGMFNGLVVSSMMGCTISFTIPTALNIVKPEQHKLVLTGFLCGLITIPIGCFAAGLICGINILVLLLDLAPMIVFSGLIALGLIYIPKQCIKSFGMLGRALKILILIGLVLAIIRYLTGIEIIKGLESLEEGGRICLNASVVMSGAFPFLTIVSRLMTKPIRVLGNKLKINEASAFGFFSTIATNVTTFEKMGSMDEKGVVLNSAFAISAAFTFAGHLAFTLSFNGDYVLYVITGKLISGIFGLVLANQIYKRFSSETV